MLFMATQKHSPEGCPLNGENCPPLFDAENKKVKIVKMYACPPEHLFYFVLEAENFDDLQEFFMPGMTRASVEIKLVMDST
jgi:hypothetical protein